MDFRPGLQSKKLVELIEWMHGSKEAGERRWTGIRGFFLQGWLQVPNPDHDAVMIGKLKGTLIVRHRSDPPD